MGRGCSMSRRMGTALAPFVLAVGMATSAMDAQDHSHGASPGPPIVPTTFGKSVDRDVERVRKATEAFKDLDRAAAAGYERHMPNCVANPPQGAMGFHHGNNALMDDRLQVDKPEILVYERMPDGAYRLNGVEYIVPLSAWSWDEPPTIMGQSLKKAPAPRHLVPARLDLGDPTPQGSSPTGTRTSSAERAVTSAAVEGRRFQFTAATSHADAAHRHRLEHGRRLVRGGRKRSRGTRHVDEEHPTEDREAGQQRCQPRRRRAPASRRRRPSAPRRRNSSRSARSESMTARASRRSR